MGGCPTPRTYFVVSEETLIRPACFGGAPEPPEYGRYVDEVQARSKREAIRVAYADPQSELQVWAKKNRADGRHPFAGITVDHPHCDHGVCLDRCEDGDPTTVCKPCDDEFHDRCVEVELMGPANDPTGALALHPESCGPDCPECEREEQWQELCDEVGCDLPVWDVDRWVPCWECERCDEEWIEPLREES